MSWLRFQNEAPPDTVVGGMPLPASGIIVTVEEGKRFIASDPRLSWGPILHRLEPPMRMRHIIFHDPVSNTRACRWRVNLPYDTQPGETW